MLLGPYFDRQARQTTQRIVVAPLRFPDDCDRLGPLGKLGQDELALEPRDRLADATVNAAAERDMTGNAALDVEFVRLLPTPRVAVRRGEEQKHLLALADAHAADIDLARRRAEEGLHR